VHTKLCGKILKWSYFHDGNQSKSIETHTIRTVMMLFSTVRWINCEIHCSGIGKVIRRFGWRTC